MWTRFTLPLVIADLAGGKWPEAARSAAVALSGSAQETSSPVSLLFADIKVVFEVPARVAPPHDSTRPRFPG